MNDLIFSNDNKYLAEHTYTELKEKASGIFGVQNRDHRGTGLESGFFSLLDGVAAEAAAGNDIIGEYPGFYQAMMEDEKLFEVFIKAIKQV
ncbi:MAG: hypothetical protein AAF902_00455 [Chloroflexota bacterium]